MDYQEEQKDLDQIVEKIKQVGYTGLTEEEKHKFFHSRLDAPRTTRFDSKIEFWLFIGLLAVLTIHGVQRLVLAREMGNTLKLNSAITNNSANMVLNIIIGVALVGLAGFSLFEFLSDLRKHRIVFFYRADDRKMKRKYYLQLAMTTVLLVLVLLKTAAYGMVFFEKIGL